MSEEIRKNRRGDLEDVMSTDLREDRIDWERKQKGKRRSDELDTSLEDDTMTRVLLQEKNERHNRKKRRDARKKKRHLVLDEETGRVVVQRRRRPHRNHLDFDEYDENWTR